MKHTTFFEKTLPLCLLGVLLLVMLVTIFVQGQSYGLTTDQGMQSNYGQAVFAWYRTLGKDQSFLHFPAEAHEPEHGPIFDVVVAAVHHVFHSQSDPEAGLISLIGGLTVIVLAFCWFLLWQ